jgi:hypothetical protein
VQATSYRPFKVYKTSRKIVENNMLTNSAEKGKSVGRRLGQFSQKKIIKCHLLFQFFENIIQCIIINNDI